MFDTRESIANNKYINNLTNEVEKYGIFGCYVDYTKAKNPINNGIYFVCGYESDKCLDKNNDLEAIYLEQQEGKTFQLDLCVLRITDNSPYAVHQLAINYALHASTMKGIGNKFLFPYQFHKVSPGFIGLAESLYKNSQREDLSWEERQRNHLALERFLRTAGIDEWRTQGNNEPDEPHMKPAKITRKSPPNMVSLEKLLYKVQTVNKIIIPKENLKTFEQALAQRPDILYWRAQTVEVKLDVPDNQGYGSKEANYASSTIFLYDQKYRKDVAVMYIQTLLPHCLRYHVNDIVNMGYGTCSLGVMLGSINSIMKKAYQRNIPIAIDFDKLYFSYYPDGTKDHTMHDGLYTLTFSKRDIDAVDAILVSEMEELKSKRILTRQDEKENAMRPLGSNAYDLSKFYNDYEVKVEESKMKKLFSFFLNMFKYDL